MNYEKKCRYVMDSEFVPVSMRNFAESCWIWILRSSRLSDAQKARINQFYDYARKHAKNRVIAAAEKGL